MNRNYRKAKGFASEVEERWAVTKEMDVVFRFYLTPWAEVRVDFIDFEQVGSKGSSVGKDVG